MAMKKAKKGPIDYPVGASSKSKKAQGDRMNAQAKSMATSKAKANSASSRRMQAQKDADVKARAAKTDAARKKPVKGYETNMVRGADKANMFTITGQYIMPGGKNRGDYDNKKGRSPYSYKYKGAGSKPKGKK